MPLQKPPAACPDRYHSTRPCELSGAQQVSAVPPDKGADSEGDSCVLLLVVLRSCHLPCRAQLRLPGLRMQALPLPVIALCLW